MHKRIKAIIDSRESNQRNIAQEFCLNYLQPPTMNFRPLTALPTIRPTATNENTGTEEIPSNAATNENTDTGEILSNSATNANIEAVTLAINTPSAPIVTQRKTLRTKLQDELLKAFSYQLEPLDIQNHIPFANTQETNETSNSSSNSSNSSNSVTKSQDGNTDSTSIIGIIPSMDCNPNAW